MNIYHLRIYFDIHITYGHKDGDGYSIPIIAENQEQAKQKAIDEKLFVYEEDVYDIDYIEEISKEEYDSMCGHSKITAEFENSSGREQNTVDNVIKSATEKSTLNKVEGTKEMDGVEY